MIRTPEQHDVNKPVCNADLARHGYEVCACGDAEVEVCSMITSERTVDSARRESIVMLFNVIGIALASAFLTGQIIWYVWKMQSIGWAPDRSSIMPVLGLLCGIVTLASLVAYLVIAWTSSPMVADRLARKSPYLLIVGTYWLFMVMTIAISRGALSTLNEGISRAVR